MANQTFDFLPLTVRLETQGGVATPLVLRGTPLPAKRSETFWTAADEQSTVEVKLLLGERPLVANNMEMGKFKLSGIPAEKRGQQKIKIEFSVGKDCVVKARASLEGAQLAAEQQFSPPKELSREFIRTTLEESEATREADQAMLQTIETVNNARRLLADAEKRLEQQPNTELSKKIAALGLALESRNAEEIRKQSELIGPYLLSPADMFGAFNFAELWAPRRQTSKNVPERPAVAKKSPQVKQALTAKSTHTLGKIFGSGEFTLDPQLCFVLMPFAQELKPVYEDHVRPVIEKAGLQCERADEIRGATVITRDIWERVNRARFLVADLTRQNPNVFYELGLAHAIGKDVILLSQSMDFVPFDLKSNRIIVYEYTPRGVKKLEEELAKTVDILMKSA